ncbi:unnamed protein product [Vitrella brassicaformis CCMP3155]|uniref:Coenzyme Q-binding protein COQ10 START domain-containing protein n=1 Tax=Vitrella brassicaformis (strain CCMP3155) TaxID=1169540 RepID=A0A0G4G6U0_VITBC|nr:unnamed protein product [Vitrella brassicaformis CCMP3155]|eukprot:CEM24432.1 unnamed protein product [Vitrella brassicaformis CCMP3155]
MVCPQAFLLPLTLASISPSSFLRTSFLRQIRPSWSQLRPSRAHRAKMPDTQTAEGATPAVHSPERPWIEHTVAKEINATREEAFDLYCQLPMHPRWSGLFRHVEWIDESARISKWTLRKLGITLSFEARNIIEQRPHIIAWESIPGRGAVANRGKVEFLPSTASDPYQPSCLMRMSVAYSIPGFVSRIFRTAWLSRFIEGQLMGDANRFEREVIKERQGKEMLVAAGGN